MSKVAAPDGNHVGKRRFFGLGFRRKADEGALDAPRLAFAPVGAIHPAGRPAPVLFPDPQDRTREVFQAFDSSQPARGQAGLFGRDEQLRKLLDAVLYRQNHGVISGSRGAGKTSLANSFAERARAEGVVVLYSSNDLESSFGSLMRQLLEQLPESSLQQGDGEDFRARVAALRADSNAQEVANLLARISYSSVVLVIDEFDRVPDQGCRTQISSLLKMCSDARLRARALLIGDERTYPDVLAGHASLARHTSHIALSPLSDPAIGALLDSCAAAAGLKFTPESRTMLTKLVCGSPYHARLFGLHAALQARADEQDEISAEHASAGLREAFSEWESINPRDAAIFRQAVADADPEQRRQLVQLAQELARRTPVGGGEAAEAGRRLQDLAHSLQPAVVAQGDDFQLGDATAAQFLLALAAASEPRVRDRRSEHKEMSHS
jgi:hypothetical protein